jgi:hypothetical protein
MVNLDTHILVFALTGEVTDRERRVLASNTWSVSAIVLWATACSATFWRVFVLGSWISDEHCPIPNSESLKSER